ncbi:MAG: HupE/UreJ family protein [Steroidobacteraceae bacterium]
MLRLTAGAWPPLLAALLAIVSAPTVAHPMPNSEISISLGANSAVFDIAIPEPELRLALPQSWPRTADLLAEARRPALAQYFDAHFAVRAASGVPVPHVIQSITRWQAQNPDVGKYEELRIRIIVPAAAGFDPHHLSLHYDAVIHQVPNHFALVYLDRDFHTGRIVNDKPVEVGVIRYDFSRDVTPSFEVTLAPGSVWRGLLAALTLGFHHVLGGVDHLLFLASLLIVSPLRPIARHWSLFQGWRYTLRRFLSISLAFTAGHSLSLLLGAYELVQLPRALVESAIAVSVLLAAVHAIRPLFAGSEWKIAAGFGLVHGLAFSETLSGASLDPMTRGYIVLGFNLGVEGAQLVAMACAVPLLYASRWRGFHLLRVAAMSCAILMAVVWIAQRAG